VLEKREIHLPLPRNWKSDLNIYQIYSNKNQIICALAWNSVLHWWRWDMSKTAEELEFSSQFLLSTLSILALGLPCVVFVGY